MNKKKRKITVLISSLSIILLAGIVGISYGLSTLTIKNSTHLQIKDNSGGGGGGGGGGSDPSPTPTPDPKPDPTPDPGPTPSTEIKASLIRTYYYEYYLSGHSMTTKESKSDENTDFSTSDSNSKNIFEMDSSTKWVPGTYFIATLKLLNEGESSFKYSVNLNVNNSSSSTLLSNLEVYYNNSSSHTFADNDKKSGLNVGSENNIINGTLESNNETYFSIKVALPESVTTGKGEKVNFDLVTIVSNS